MLISTSFWVFSVTFDLLFYLLFMFVGQHIKVVTLKDQRLLIVLKLGQNFDITFSSKVNS